ncbi:MAG: hypothetical protein Q4F29_01345 [Lachnospiraceae bacterium]|nr:hypothetical protein [Lachnospiraceae bacterium]
MLEFLQTGKAIYVLTAICLIGMMSKLTAGRLYKRLIRETGNMMLTKNKWLRELRQRAEDTYRLNQGVANTGVFVEKQIYEARMGLFTPGGWSAFSNQMTALCFLLGGGLAFLSYWYRCDSYYMILYGSMGFLAGLFNIMVDYGTGLEDKRHRLSTCIQDYLENSLWKRLSRDRLPELEEEQDGAELVPAAAAREPGRPLRGRKREAASGSEAGGGARGRASGNSGISGGGGFGRTSQKGRNGSAQRNGSCGQTDERLEEPDGYNEPRSGTQPDSSPSSHMISEEALNQLRKSLEQAAAGRSVPLSRSEKSDSGSGGESRTGESWMKDLKPEEIKVLGEIIREYLG